MCFVTVDFARKLLILLHVTASVFVVCGGRKTSQPTHISTCCCKYNKPNLLIIFVLKCESISLPVDMFKIQLHSASSDLDLHTLHMRVCPSTRYIRAFFLSGKFDIKILHAFKFSSLHILTSKLPYIS